MYLTMRTGGEKSSYLLSNDSNGSRYWWMNLEIGGTDIGPFNSRDEAIAWGKAHGHVG